MTCDRQEKVAYSPQVSLESFLQITNSFRRYSELNRLWVGWSKFPFYELGQQERGQGCIRNKCDWQLVTLISWCQMNRLGHSSPVMHKVEGKTNTILEKLKMTSGKSTLFWKNFVKYFQITRVDIWISLNKNNNTPILHTCLTSCWSCLCSTTGHAVVQFFWGFRKWKSKKL